MSTRLCLALAGALLIVRLPSLAQPIGPDQGLYAYVGDRILHGDLAYRDAWDQKPPAIHYIYAALRAVYPRDAAVAAADLAAAVVVAALLWRLGDALAGPPAGGLAAVLFLLLSDPSFARYGGMRVRAQCETFIALSVTAALALAIGRGSRAGRQPADSPSPSLFGAGIFIGVAVALKYNAAIYGGVALVALALVRRLRWRDVLVLTAGAALVPLVLLAVFVAAGAAGDLYQATIVYNVRYSGETYATWGQMVTYLLTSPIQHARVDALWFLGGLGSIVLLIAGATRRILWLPVIWTAAACVSIAINGSRGLPQYFLQAAPALALGAGVAAVTALKPLPRLAAALIVAMLAVGVWRVNDFPKLTSNIAHDARYVAGAIDRRTYLARYGGQRDSDKYSALDNLDLGDLFRTTTEPADTVYVFGFSSASYVYGQRRSASRFFWSRPVILGFRSDDPRYGVQGVLSDLERNRPAMIVLQHRDWAPDVEDSAPFFMGQPSLASWLRAHYHAVPGVEGFDTWRRNAS